MRLLPRKPRIIIILAVAACVAVTAVVIAHALYIGPEQPIPFSHRIHAGTKHISCIFCHPNATRSSNAGMPPVEKCAFCHKVIATNFKPISKIFSYYDRNQPIPWVRVYVLPDFVRFNHQAHIAAGRDCGDCHGDVTGMDRIKVARKIDMNFCVSCHWKNKVSTDCYTCHY